MVSGEAVDRALAFPVLIEAIADAFRGGLVSPERHHHTVGRAPGRDATLLLMPAWTRAGAGPAFLGVKIATVFPDNARRDLPSVLGTYLLLDGGTGLPLASIDGTRLTLWRTAATSALAASHLARADASRMVMVGGGALAGFLVRAHAAVRPLERIEIWTRRPEAAREVAARLAAEGLPVVATGDLAAAVAAADLVSCATLASEPLIRGEWLRPGCHLDLVGAFTPAMREADDAALARASVFVDTPACLHEGGDVTVAIRDGTFAASDVRGDLADLATGRVAGRRSAEEITLFKSIGASIEDLAAAVAVWHALQT